MQNQPQEKEWAGSILYLLKLEATALCTATIESANDTVRNHVTGLLNKSLQNQKSLFDLMNKKGWYKVEAAPQEQYSRIQQSFTTMQSQMQSFQQS
ncbi:spore coat protein [Acetivibrio cellulolyticus]|uniref:spore coat protein n=1 Tax=Acetivibrio cellulolyticus TaxID=35830 RepID=UPI0001E2BE1C|nr:spore coat protein [Acetivibrio cellulolyticus]